MAEHHPHESAQVAALRRGVINLMSSAAVRAISFTMSGVTLNTEVLSQVELRLREWPTGQSHRPGATSTNYHFPIHIFVNPHALDRNSEAEYWPDENALVFRQTNLLSGLRGQATVVHECVHAALDIWRHRELAYIEEAVAFVAEYLYQLNLGTPANTSCLTPTSDVERASLAIAEGVFYESRRHVPDQQAATLISAVGREYRRLFGTTSHSRYRGNGVNI